MSKGYFNLVLHAHLPYVRHPMYDRFLEEMWLFEAVSESYLPLLRVLNRLRDDGVKFRLTLSVSPTLASMLTDELLQNRYVEHLKMLLDLAEKELARTAGDDRFHPLAQMYKELLCPEHGGFHGDLSSQHPEGFSNAGEGRIHRDNHHGRNSQLSSAV